MNPQDHVVVVVDDDVRIRESVSELLASFDLLVVTFASAAEYLAYPRPYVPACLILDMQLPDINGLDLQSRTEDAADEYAALVKASWAKGFMTWMKRSTPIAAAS